MMTVAVCAIVLVYFVATPVSGPKRQASLDEGSIRKMSNALKTKPCAPSSTHTSPGGLPSPQEKKTSVSLVSSSFLNPFRRHPFLSSVVVSMTFTGIFAGVMNRSYTPSKRDPFSQIPPNENGVSYIAGFSWVRADHASQIALIGHSYPFDETSQQLLISWEVLGCGAYRLSTHPSPTNMECGSLDRAADIHFN